MARTSPQARHPLTLVVAKLGALRFLGHRDFARGLSRALRRTGLPLVLTEGYHPHVRLSLPDPLPVSVASEGEHFVVWLREPLPVETVRRSLAEQLAAGWQVVDVLPGHQREPLDAPLVLFLEGDEPGPLGRELARLAEREESVESVEIVPEAGGVRGVLRPQAGRRAPLGRILRELRARGEGRVGWLRSVVRRRALHSP